MVTHSVQLLTVGIVAKVCQYCCYDSKRSFLLAYAIFAWWVVLFFFNASLIGIDSYIRGRQVETVQSQKLVLLRVKRIFGARYMQQKMHKYM